MGSDRLGVWEGEKMINRELLMISAMTSGGLLGSLGGYRWKWLRRFVLPTILAVLALLGGVLWWKCLILCLGLMAAFCLPYGERTPYWGKFLVGCAFVLPTAVMGFSWWQVFTPIIFIAMFFMSNWKFTEKIFRWKIIEFITFALVGVTVASLI
jgi:hypothetical protein